MDSRVDGRLEELGCDPIAGLARIAEDPATKIELKVKCYTELAQYVHPKRKAMELGTKDGSAILLVHSVPRPER